MHLQTTISIKSCNKVISTLVIILLINNSMIFGSNIPGHVIIKNYPTLQNFITNQDNSLGTKGWFLYEPIPPIDENVEETGMPEKIININIDWEQFKQLPAKDMRSLINELMDISISKPSKNNVQNYMIAQRIATAKATKYMSVWQDVIKDHPTLDETVKRPPTGFASFQLSNAKENTINQVVAHIADDKNIGLVLFYLEGNYYSELQLPIVQRLVNRTQWEPFLSLNLKDHKKTAAEYGVETVPEIWLVEKNGKKVRVTAGLRTADVIRKNMVPAYEKMLGKRITKDPYEFLNDDLMEKIGVE